MFSEPYPCPSSAGQRWLISAVVGFGVFIFLFIFRPFGLSGETSVTGLSAAYGLIAFLVTLFDQFVFPATFPSWFDEKRWTVGKHIIFTCFVFVTVGAANFFYSHFLGFISFSAGGFLYYQLITLLVGAFPVSLLIIISYTWLLRRNLRSAGIIRQAIPSVKTPPEGKELLLRSENKNDDLLILRNDLLYIAAADNYVEAVYRSGNGIKKKLLRNTLSAMEALSGEYPELYRCHRAYLVNLTRVRNITGNSQGCKLVVDGLEVALPVSRSQYRPLLQRLKELN